MKKTLLLFLGLICTVGSAQALLFCQNGACVEAENDLSKNALFQNVAQIIEQNSGKNILLCDADPSTFNCLNGGISVQARSNLVQMNLIIPSAEILATKQNTDAPIVAMDLDYMVFSNAIKPKCQSSATMVAIRDVGQASAASEPFVCAFTTQGHSTLKITYDINYINIDTATMGGTYVVSAEGGVQGGGSGYALMRFTNMAPNVVFEQFSARNPQLELPRTLAEIEEATEAERTALDLPPQSTFMERCQDAWVDIKKGAVNFWNWFEKVLYLEPIE